MTITFDGGNGEVDQFIDIAPYSHNPHLKLQMEEYVITSIGLVITKASGATGGTSRLSNVWRRISSR